MAIRTEEPRPLRAEFATNEMERVADRFLLLPIRADADKLLGMRLAGGSLTISGSAWSGLALGKGWSGDSTYLNLGVVDLETGTRRDVFERQVALGGWQHSFRTDEPGRTLCYPGKLILTARPADTTNDRQIDARDAVQALVYDLPSGVLTPISPPGHSVTWLEPLATQILLALTDSREPAALAIYAYDVETGRGRFVAEALRP